jgi:hypothetical protein
MKQQNVNNIKILTENSVHFEICRLFHMHQSNVWFICYSNNNGLPKTKWWILLQSFVKSNLPCSQHHTDKVDEETQRELPQLPCHSVLDEIFSDMGSANFFICILISKKFQFAFQIYVIFGSIYFCKLIKWNRSSDYNSQVQICHQ